VASWQQAVAGAAFLACISALFAACGNDPAPPPAAQRWQDPGYVESGGLRLHYALTPTLDLAAGIAGSYGIEQRDNLALLTLTWSASGGAIAQPPQYPAPRATAVTLTGRRLPLVLERRDAATGPTWLATVVFRDREPLTIEIEARLPTTGSLATRFTRTLSDG
jgi:hypothetical protein